MYSSVHINESKVLNKTEVAKFLTTRYSLEADYFDMTLLMILIKVIIDVNTSSDTLWAKVSRICTQNLGLYFFKKLDIYGNAQ